MSARVRLPESLSGLLRSELEEVIYEAALSREDELIARRYFIEKVPQIDIAVEIGYERSTINRRLKEIEITMVQVAAKLKIK